MFIPHTMTDREEMLQKIGLKSLEELFQDVPAAHRFPELKSTLSSYRDGGAG